MRMISMILLEQCNLRCDYCFANKTNLKARLNIESVKKFVLEYSNHIGKIDIVILTGGEPLLYNDLDELIVFLQGKVDNIVLLTNGILLTDEHLKLFARYKVNLAVSIDSIHSDYHERIRGKQKEVQNVLDHIAEDYKDIPVTLSATISTKNIEEIPYLNLYAKQRNFKIQYGITDVDAEKSYSWQRASAKYKNRYIEMMGKYGNYSKVELEFIRKVLMNEKTKSVSCYFANHNIVISTNGDLTNCFKNNSRILGNINGDIDTVISYLKNSPKICGDCVKLGCLSEFLGK